jgi:hypothetical protein
MFCMDNNNLGEEFFSNLKYLLEVMLKDESNMTFDEVVEVLSKKKVLKKDILKYISFLKHEHVLSEMKTKNSVVYVADFGLVQKFISSKDMKNKNVWNKFGLSDSKKEIVREVWIDNVQKRINDFIFDGTFLLNGEFIHFSGYEDGNGPKVIITKNVEENLSSYDIEWIEKELAVKEKDLFDHKNYSGGPLSVSAFSSGDEKNGN